MAVRGQKATGVGVNKPKKKPATKQKPIAGFKQYESKESADKSSTVRTSSGSKQTAPKIRGIKSILANYRATAPKPSGANKSPTRRISPNKVTRLKQQRATEASEATIKSYKKAPNAPKTVGGQAKQMSDKRRNRPTSFALRQKAPSKTFGKYKKVAASPLNVDDYRKDERTVGGVERRNKQVSDSRERSRIKAARKKRYG